MCGQCVEESDVPRILTKASGIEMDPESNCTIFITSKKRSTY